MDPENVYLRQRELNLYMPESVTVIGLGGTGSWVALNLALVGVPNLILVDPDVLEDHNLNRTPYTRMQACFGISKVAAVGALIKERRGAATALTLHNNPVEEVLGQIPWEQQDFVIDCTDTLSTKEHIFPQVPAGRYLRLGYDGEGLQFDATSVMPWGDQGAGYQVVPSFLCPPQFLACVAVAAITLGLEFPEHPLSYDRLTELVARITNVNAGPRQEYRELDEDTLDDGPNGHFVEDILELQVVMVEDDEEGNTVEYDTGLNIRICQPV